jgi:hypothetical protein
MTKGEMVRPPSVPDVRVRVGVVIMSGGVGLSEAAIAVSCIGGHRRRGQIEDSRSESKLSLEKSVVLFPLAWIKEDVSHIVHVRESFILILLCTSVVRMVGKSLLAVGVSDISLGSTLLNSQKVMIVWKLAIDGRNFKCRHLVAATMAAPKIDVCVEVERHARRKFESMF